MGTVYEHEDDPDFLALTNQCRRICLQAGADPTLPYGKRIDFLGDALNDGTMVSVELKLRKSFAN